MPDLVTRLKLDNSQYNSGIDSAKQKTKELQDTAEGATKSLKDMGDKGAKSAKDLLNEMSNVEKAGRSASNYRKQLAEIQKQIVDLTVGYRNMSSEMQNSALGQEVAAKIQELTNKAATYKDAILDVQQDIAKMASDTAVWDSIAQGFDVASSALQGFVSVGVLGEQSTEKLVAVIAKLQSIQAATNAVIKIGNALQKQSALMQGIARIQTLALAKAKTLEAAATGKATVAQKLFNAVAKANPYVLLAAAIVAVVGAIAAFTIAAKKNKEQMDFTTKAQKAYNSALEAAKDEAATTIAKFTVLEQQYKNLRTEGDKQKWIKDNADKFQELGYKIDDVNTADDVFINHAKDVVKAMQLRAEAAAILSVYQEEYAKVYKESLDLEKKKSNTKGGMFTKKDWKKAGLIEGEDYVNHQTTYSTMYGTNTFNNWELTESGKKKMEEYGKSQGEAYRDGVKEGMSPMLNDMQNLIAEADSLDSKWRITVDDTTVKNTTKTVKELEKPLESELSRLQAAKKELEAQLPYIKEGTEEWKEQYKKINDTEKKIKELEDAIKAYKDRLNYNFELVPKIDDSKLKKELTYDVTLKPRLSNDELVDEFKNAQELTSKIQNWFDLGLIGKEKAEEMVKAINNTLSSKGIKLKVNIDTNSLAASLTNVVNMMDTIASTGNAVSSINSIYDSISNLTDKLDEASNSWEQFFAIFEAGMNIFNSVTTIIESVATATQLLNSVKQASAAASQQEAAAALTDAGAQSADAAAALSNAGAHGAAGAAKAGESVAGIPIAGPALAVAAIGAVMAAIIGIIASAKKFNKGGIVDSASKIGDKNFVRVNGGEMILNQKQQDNLFKMLNEGREQKSSNLSGEVEFKINGTQLVGVLNNYSKKNNKI